MSQSPTTSPATHTAIPEQATVASDASSWSATVQFPAAGAVLVRISPSKSAAVQSDAEAQATAVSARPASTVATRQAPPPGLVELSNRPASSTATQSEADGQATP